MWLCWLYRWYWTCRSWILILGVSWVLGISTGDKKRFSKCIHDGILLKWAKGNNHIHSSGLYGLNVLPGDLHTHLHACSNLLNQHLPIASYCLSHLAFRPCSKDYGEVCAAGNGSACPGLPVPRGTTQWKHHAGVPILEIPCGHYFSDSMGQSSVVRPSAPICIWVMESAGWYHLHGYIISNY